MVRLNQATKRIILQSPLGRGVLLPFRLRTALSYCFPRWKQAIRWVFSSRELANFTYDLTPINQEYLAHVVSIVTQRPLSVVLEYIREVREDEDLTRHMRTRIGGSSMRYCCDSTCAVGRRMGWYAFVRALKPRTIVETGVDKGLGSVVLCAALIRNDQEGFPGRYYGTDINPTAGFLFSEPYTKFGKILYGDSLQSLETIPKIDVFINDSDHSADYERREYEAILPKLSRGGLILGDNCHVTDVLARFSERNNRKFIFFQEQPMEHWYPGAGIGVSFEE
jgi:predicted O-methyltransferase YrrM